MYVVAHVLFSRGRATIRLGVAATQGFIQDFLLGVGGGGGRFIETFPHKGASGMPKRNHDI